MPPPRYWTEDRIVEAVAKFAAREERAPRYGEFAKVYGLPDRRIVERRMRSWQEPMRRLTATRLKGDA
jgi:hypothetical protein